MGSETWIPNPYLDHRRADGPPTDTPALVSLAPSATDASIDAPRAILVSDFMIILLSNGQRVWLPLVESIRGAH